MEKAIAREVPEAEVSRETDRQGDVDRRALEHQHTELERQLAALERHLSLTPDEQVEQRRLKKQKLWVKDQLLRLGLPHARGA